MYVLTYSYKGLYPPTACKLADELDAELGNDLEYAIESNEPVVNWGYSIPEHLRQGEIPTPILNRLAPLSKAQAFSVLQHEGIRVPKFLTTAYIIRNKRHSGGKDIVMGKENTFVVERIEKHKEYRVEVFGSRAFRAHEKYLKDELSLLASPPFNWNRGNTEGDSFGYNTMRDEVGDDVIDLGKKAIEVIGYDFGAVDINRSKEGELYVLEINSAPQLNGIGLLRYCSRIRKWASNHHA